MTMMQRVGLFAACLAVACGLLSLVPAGSGKSEGPCDTPELRAALRAPAIAEVGWMAGVRPGESKLFVEVASGSGPPGTLSVEMTSALGTLPVPSSGPGQHELTLPQKALQTLGEARVALRQSDTLKPLEIVTLPVPEEGRSLSRCFGASGSILPLEPGAATPMEPNGGAAGAKGRWTSLVPTVVAVLLAVIFRQVLTALLAGVIVGAFLAYGPNPVTALANGFTTFVWANLYDSFNAYILGFATTLFGVVRIVSRSGGVQGVLNVLTRYANSARSTKLAAWGMGLALFFDDYSNSMLVGTTLRSVTDRFRVSREKLAYIVDSTAAPVAGLSLLSTWIAYEVGLFQEIGESLGLAMGGYEIFLSALPMRFYCIGALFFVFAGAMLGRDFGPMLAAERRTAQTGEVHGPDARPLTGDTNAEILAPEGRPQRWVNAVVPVATLLAASTGLMLWTGAGAVEEAGLSFNLLDFAVWREAFGGADSSFALFWAAALAALVALALPVAQGIMPVKEGVTSFFSGIAMTRVAIAVLFLAWAIKSVCDTLNADDFMISVLAERMAPELLPVTTFFLAAAIAFATGTSWGTMGILLPVALPLAFTLSPDDGGVIFSLVAAAVLDGAIFGDHCSPISDTTVLSSMASGCDHIDHVRTQMPYALTVMLTASLFGYLSVPMGLPLALGYLLVGGSLVLSLWLIGRPVEAEG